MNNPIFRLILFLFTSYFFTSCSTPNFTTKSNLDKNTNANLISKCEVSVRDWMTYLVSTSFPGEDEVIFLGDQLDKIGSKLPELDMPGWCSYTVKAVLRKEDKMVMQKVFNHCTQQNIKIGFPAAAWDSIDHYGLLDLPIVGITYEQAMEYVGYKQTILNTCEVNPKKSKEHYRFECFLPTPGEFGSIQIKIDSVNYPGCNLFNFKDALCEDCPNGKKWAKNPVLKRTGKEPTAVDTYFPYPIGLYNVPGNVAEMTSMKGIAMGGSCHHYAALAFDGKIQGYTKPEEWLGFRVWYRKLLIPEKKE